VRLRARGEALRTLLIYLSAAVVYIVVGVFYVDFMLSVFVAAGYLVIATWLVPMALRRLG
jgi:hypothetical protein